MNIDNNGTKGPKGIAFQYAIERLDNLIDRGKKLLEAGARPGSIDAHDIWYEEAKSTLDLVAPEFVVKLGAVWPRVCERWNGECTPRAISENILGQIEVLRSARGTIHHCNKEPITPTYIVAQELRQSISITTRPETRGFVYEAITCLENNLYRAAVVLSWVGAVSVLHNYVIKNHLHEFNNEARNHTRNWSNANTIDDLACIKEWNFLNVLQNIRLINKNTKQQLQKCLELRNGCGHPNTMSIGANIVAAHIEVLILNVFTKF